MTDTQIQPKNFYHLAQSDATNPLAGKSLATLLMKSFEKILQELKKGMIDGKSQIENITKLQKDVANLMRLINDISKVSDAKEGDLAQKIQAAIKTLKGDIDELPAAQYTLKKSLLSSLKSLEVLFSDKQRLESIAKFYKALQNLLNNFPNTSNPSQAQVDAFINAVRQFTNAKVALVGAPPNTKGQIQVLIKDFPQIGGQLRDLMTQIESMWSWFVQINDGTDVPIIGFVGGNKMGQLVQAIELGEDPAKLQKMAKGFLEDRNYTYTGFTGRAQNFLDTFKQPEVTLDAKEILEILKRAIKNPEGPYGQAFSNLYKEWVDADSNLAQIETSSASVSAEAMTSIYESMSIINTLAAKFSRLINVPINLVNKEINAVMRGDNPYSA